MRCPKCNWFKVFEDYNRSLPVTDDETLEESEKEDLIEWLDYLNNIQRE